MKNILLGFIIGITSLIPGISAGTIIYVTEEFDYITTIITNLKKNIKNVALILLGLLLGVLLFSKVIEFLFTYFAYETIYLFIGFLLCNFRQTVKKQTSINSIYIAIGILMIYVLSLFSVDTNLVVTNYPTLTFHFLIFFALCGCLDGFLTITPGISGSMVMMLLGPYYLYKSYLANVTNTPMFWIPLVAYFLGDFLGIYLGSLFSKHMLKKHYTFFSNMIIGMVMISIILLIPPYVSISCLLSLFIGYSLVKKIKK